MQECRMEDELRAALAGAVDAESLPPHLREHMERCPACSETAAVMEALRQERQRLTRFAACPDAGALWRRLQRRAWEEAAVAAGRPIAAAQVLALAAAAAVAGACYGATSAWLQTALRRAAGWACSMIEAAHASPSEYSLWWLAAAAGVMLLLGLPVALCLALSSDRP